MSSPTSARPSSRTTSTGCTPCLEAFDFEAELRILVSTKCREEAPDALRQRVIDALRDCDPATEPAAESDA